MIKFYEDGLKDCSWIPDSYELFEEYISTKRIILHDKAMVIYSGDKDFLYIDTIYVMKKFRGNGIATKLLRSFEGRVALICNRSLTTFYDKLGFKKVLPYDIVVKDNR